MNEHSQFCTAANNKLFHSLDVKSAAPIHKNKTANAHLAAYTQIPCLIYPAYISDGISHVKI